MLITLPHDILRLIFENAAIENTKTAFNLALVSRFSQKWVERILYSVVNLHRESTQRAFLRTIETSRTKSLAFFATTVKSLCISYDVHNDRTGRIIGACRGVTCLTFWVVSYTTSPTIPPAAGTLNLARTAYSDISAALSTLRPIKLSILLTGHTGIHGSPHPQFHLDFFQRVTHLSVVDRWEEWVTWKGFEMLPCLTHVSFDVGVGVEMEGLVYDYDYDDDDDDDQGFGQGIQQRGTGGNAPSAFLGIESSSSNRTRDIGKALSLNVLSKCKNLKVCVVLLIFGVSPVVTAKAISDAATIANASSSTDGPVLDPDSALVASDSEITRTTPSSPGPGNSCSCSNPDPRLVFVHDTEPFLDREAHSIREARVWEMAERVMKLQTDENGSGRGVVHVLHKGTQNFM